MKNKIFFALQVCGILCLVLFSVFNLIHFEKDEFTLPFSYPTENIIEDYIFHQFVYLSGAVNKPGVYQIFEGERLINLIERAGGFTINADYLYIAQNINLAAKVNDEEKYFFPENQSESLPTGTSLININSADKALIETLPGIGPSLAEVIISGRPYEAVEDLLDVRGIGESIFGKIKDLIKI